MDAKRFGLTCLAVSGSLVMFAGSAWCAEPAQEVVAAGGSQASEGDQQVVALLDRLSALSEFINRNADSPQAYRSQLEQADVLTQLAVHSKPPERDNWMRMAVDNLFSAATQSTGNDQTAYTRLAHAPERIAQVYPDSPIAAYAALQVVEADYSRAIQGNSDEPAKAQARRRDSLVAFAQQYTRSPEAPKALWEAARVSIALGQMDAARQCYRSLADQYSGQGLARKAAGALWRLEAKGQPVKLTLPLLYQANEQTEPPFDLDLLLGKAVAVYFWSSTSAQAATDFQALKDLGDRYASRGFEMVFVNMDDKPEQAREFLGGRLTRGVHLYQAGGLDGEPAGRLGIQTLPEVFLIGADGTLLRHSLTVSQIEPLLTGHAATARND